MLGICLYARRRPALVRNAGLGLAAALVLGSAAYSAWTPIGSQNADLVSDSGHEAAAPDLPAAVEPDAPAPSDPAPVSVAAAVVDTGDEYRPRQPEEEGARSRALLSGPANPLLRGIRLSDDDAARYRRIFELQAGAAWDAADQEMSGLHDRRLIGQILRQRYLHPASTRVAYDDLRLWLKRYGEQPGAERIHVLAVARQPKGAPPPPDLPDPARLGGSLEEKATWGDAGVAPRSRSTMGHSSEGPVSDRIDTHLRNGKLAAALKVLGDDALTRRMDTVSYDSLRTRIAAALFYNGSPRTALALAEASADRSGAAVPGAHWIAGLVSWREGRIAAAARHFEAMASVAELSPWDASAASYWAARARERLGESGRAERWLDSAARWDRTFYGQIARRALGRAPVFQWQVPPLTPRHLAAVADTKAGYRALALIQIGQDDLAEQELRRIHPRDNAVLAEALVALADDAGLPALALQVGNAVASPDGGTYDAALYPLPHWEPTGGFTVDRALLFAIMRQESRFEPRLTSHAGATGVMQLMPETAHDVAGDGVDYSGPDRRRLFDPQWNMGLGQRYVASLLGSPQIAGNLCHLAAAYNAGPANLLRWRHELEDAADPLLFIESIPMRETRDYVRKVLANYWIYQARLGQRALSLEALAAGSWPVYTPDSGTQVAVRDEN